eukprot:g20501.t1
MALNDQPVEERGRQGLAPEDPLTRAEFISFLATLGAPEPQRLRYPVFSNGKSRGFAWATFPSPDVALDFVSKVHERHLPNFEDRRGLGCLPYDKTSVPRAKVLAAPKEAQVNVECVEKVMQVSSKSKNKISLEYRDSDSAVLEKEAFLFQ